MPRRRRVAAVLTLSSLLAAAALIAPTGHADPGFLDPSFGQNGIVTLPGGDRYDAQDSPLTQQSGRIVVAGLLRNSSDRVFLEGLTKNGAVDSAFGSGGEVHSGVVAPARRAATGLLPDGRIVIAGGSERDGRVTVERYTANGATDSTLGSNGRLTADLGGTFAKANAVVGLANGNTLVAAAASTSGGKSNFAILRFTNSGLDNTFGTKGIVRVDFGSKSSAPFDMAVQPDGKIVVAGVVGDPAAASGADTGVIRLNANGSLDSSFGGGLLGGGKVTTNAAGGTVNDYAAGVAIDSNNSIVVTGPAGTGGMVTRYTTSGGLDSTFGNGGIVLGGMAASGQSFSPAALAIDGQRRIAVAGSAVSGGTTRWNVARLNPSGASPVDTDFGQGGHVTLDQCANSAGFGPSGVGASDAGSITVLGSCDADGKIAVARLIGGKAFPTTSSLSISPTKDAAGHERIPLDGLDPSALVKVSSTLQGTALRSTALRSTALRSTALRSTALRSTALRSTALRSTLLSSIALRSTTWEQLLGVDVPLQTLTLDDAFQINPTAVGNLTLADLDPNSTALRSTTLAALLFGGRPLSALPAPGGGWCSFLASQPFNCGNGVDPATSTLFDLEISGDDLAAYYASPISLKATSLGTGDSAAPLANIRLSDLDLTVAPFKNVKASDVGSILACGSSCQGTLAEQTPQTLGNATLGQLVALMPVPALQDLSLGEAILAMLTRAGIPYEQLDLARLLDQAAIRSSDNNTYDATFDVDCAQAGSLIAIPQLPDDARTVPGTATLAVNGGAAKPVADAKPSDKANGARAYDLSGTCQGLPAGTLAHGELRFDAEPGSDLGQFTTAAVRFQSAYGASTTNTVNTAVDDSHDPGNGFTDALPLGPDAILTGHIADSQDVDTYTFTGVPGQTTITLSHVPADFDVLVYGPAVGPASTALRSTALRSTALRSTPVPDASQEPTDPSVLAPDQVQDIALRSTALRSTSINRGTADESATVVVHPDEAGETFTVQVVGYNGASSEKPYVLRRIDSPSPAALPCPTRSLSSGFHGTFPSSVPSDTRTLYLVDPERMAARDGQQPTADLMAKLQNQLAPQTQGVVVPVEDDPTVSTSGAFAAWDADPCSAEAANAVVTRINEVVDHVRQMGGGLPQLRSIVLVGPDDVLPQARVPDYTVLSNESEYANEATVDRNGDGQPDDNAISGSLRDGFMLSDDPYGDLDPTSRLYVPDVALGRLVETPAQIQAQVQAFIDSNGVVSPQRAFVTGYDFLTDGAQAELGALGGAVPSGSAQSRIDETWTAQDAVDGMNAAGAGFLALNAHYDHFRALPAAAFNGQSPNLVSASQVNAPPGSLAFTIGCHGGLSFAIADASNQSDPALGDWVQRMAQQRVQYAGNTGYGYGDDASVAYSERLMADYADGLAGRQVTTGQALMFAKQADAASLGVDDDYWNKASMEATYYGLPMYRIGADGGVGDPAVPPAPSNAQGAPAATRTSTPLSLDLSGDLSRHDTDRGSFWQVGDEDPLVVQHRPIEPKTSVDVTSATDGPAHSFLIESLTTHDVAGVNPVLALPTVDTSAHEPEPTATNPFFPATLATVQNQATPDGRRDLLTFVAGSTRDDTQRLVDSVGGRVMRSTAGDYTAPTIRRVDGTVIGNGFTVRVETDGDDAVGGNVLYLTDADVAGGGTLHWHRSDLSKVGPGLLATGGTLPNGTRIDEAIVQVYDADYNVATSNKKVTGFSFAPVPNPGPGDPRVVFNPATPSSGYFASPPTISLDKGAHGNALFQRSVDGGPYVDYDGAFTIPSPAEGEHLVSFRGSDGSIAISRFAVDSQGPTIVGEADRPADANGWYAGPVTVTFHCADAVSGVASCPAPATINQEGTNRSVTGTATDRAGNQSSTTVGGFNVDLLAPTETATALSAPNSDGWYKAPVTVRYTCHDGVSGLAMCGGKALTGAPADDTETATISNEGRGIAALARAQDVAGHTVDRGPTPMLNIDMTKPSVAVTSNQTVFFSTDKFRGTAGDNLSGVKTVVVTYSSQTSSQVTTKSATLSCNADKTSCTWAAALPGLGVWRATVRATDYAGNFADTAPRQITVSLTG
jgi:uncharacterized delta-60 repeat protein